MRWLLAGCAAVALSTGAAFAGPCSQQIASLQRTLSTRDAGAGPVKTSPDATAGSQVSEAGSGTRTTSEATRGPAEIRTNGQSGGTDRTGPTAAVGGAAGASATSSQDVRLQQQGLPTQAQAALNGTPAAAAGQDRLQRVAGDIARARSLDSKNDNGCLAAVNDARKALTAD